MSGRNCFITVFFLLMLISMMTGPVLSQDVDSAELKDRFFKLLTDDQKVQLLTRIDQTEQLTSVELGAKYNWGYIPPDRTPPFSLAEWWDDLNERQRRRQRVQWFNNHYQQLNVDRAARELELRDQLSELYRELQQPVQNEGIQFEEISFPSEPLTVDTATQDPLPDEYRRFQSGSDQTTSPETPRRPAQPSDGGTTKSPDPRPEPAPSGSASEQAGPDTPSKPAEPESTPGRSVDSDTPEDTPTQWQREFHTDQGSVIYERVGDQITVIRQSPSDTHLQREPEYEFPIRSDDLRGLGDIQPPLREDGQNVSPPLRYRDDQREPSPGTR